MAKGTPPIAPTPVTDAAAPPTIAAPPAACNVPDILPGCFIQSIAPSTFLPNQLLDSSPASAPVSLLPSPLLIVPITAFTASPNFGNAFCARVSICFAMSCA